MADKTCFVIMPFKTKTAADRKLQHMYQHAIKPAVECAEFKCVRSDEIPAAGLVTEHIVKWAYTSDVIIADLTNSNPNVMYELGLGHAFAKPVIMLAQDPRQIPFDLQTYRTIKYHTNLGGDEALRQEVSAALQALQQLEQIKEMRTNPVHLFLPEIVEHGGYAELIQRIKQLEEENTKLKGKSDLAESIITNLGATLNLDQIQQQIDEQADDDAVTVPLESANGARKLVFERVPKSKRALYRTKNKLLKNMV